MGFESSESAVAVLGMEGFVLLAALEVDGELHQLIESKASVVGCSGCGARAVSKGGALYRNSSWDLVDRLKEDPKFDVKKLKDEELSDELAKQDAEASEVDLQGRPSRGKAKMSVTHSAALRPGRDVSRAARESSRQRRTRR